MSAASSSSPSSSSSSSSSSPPVDATAPPKMINEAARRGVEVAGWRVTTERGAMLGSHEHEALQAQLGAPTLPEMVFPRNLTTFLHNPSGLQITLDARDALREWNFRSLDGVPEVAVSKAWKAERTKKIDEVHAVKQSYDWTFTTPYSGTVRKRAASSDNDAAAATTAATTAAEPDPLATQAVVATRPTDAEPTEETSPPTGVGSVSPSQDAIDIERLKRRDPILYFDELLMFEDELGDQGNASIIVRVRVMRDYWYCLMRFWLRVDGVMFRVIDTRFFHDFSTSWVMRERKVLEDSYDAVVTKLPPPASMLKDDNAVAAVMTERSRTTERISMV